MRGVHAHSFLKICAVQGSSPHARGPLEGWGRSSWSQGIIPACAGSTLLYKAIPERIEDHPRMRGVHWNSE